MKVIAVEDDPTAGLMIESVLKSLGHEVFLVTSAIAALKIHQREKIRVIVSDWGLPGTDGLDLCRLVRSNPEDYSYFILLTQQEANEANEQLAIDAGVDDFLTKPVRVREMRYRLHVAERILRYTQQLKQLESILPICGYCKKVRDDENYWDQIEGYISKHTGSKFSHSVCPDCYQKNLIPQLPPHP